MLFLIFNSTCSEALKKLDANVLLPALWKKQAMATVTFIFVPFVRLTASQ